MKKVALLLSGGVDSSVSLRLLLDAGYDVTAFYLKIWLEDELAFLGKCPWQEDLGYAQAVCDQAGVPLHVISMQKEYWQEVVAYAIAEVKAGRTPNPDVLCNQRIKFGAFYKKIDGGEFGNFDFVGTGHYAQIIHTQDKAILKEAPDIIKDQTYFLCHLSQEQLKRVLFPIGHLAKSQVRELANQYNLANKDRKDSQGICFLGKLKFSEFLKYNVGQKEGDLIEFETGKKLGIHNGFWFYTIGQRHSIGLSGGPWYVVSKDTQNNKIFISRNYYTEDKHRDTFEVSNFNWINKPDSLDVEFKIKLRHGPKYHIAKLEGLGQNKFKVKLNESDQGIAAGQFAVLYKDGVCFGGGVIL